MIIQLFIYLTIFTYIFIKTFYYFIKFYNYKSGNVRRLDAFSTFFSMHTLPFYLNLGKINLIIFILIFVNVLIFVNPLPYNIVYCQDDISDSTNNESYINSLSDEQKEQELEELELWEEKAEEMSNKFIKDINDFTDQKRLKLLKEYDNGNEFIYEAKEIIKEEYFFKKKFDSFVEKDLMPSNLLKDCLFRFKISVETTEFFFKEFFNSKITSLYNMEDLRKINKLKDINNDILYSLKSFEKDYEWSSSSDEDEDN